MGWESSDVFKFDLCPRLQGQMMVHWLKRIRGCYINFALYKCFYSILFFGGYKFASVLRCIVLDLYNIQHVVESYQYCLH